MQQLVLILPIRRPTEIVLRKVFQPAGASQRRAAVGAPAAALAVAAAAPAGRGRALTAAGLFILLLAAARLARLACGRGRFQTEGL